MTAASVIRDYVGVDIAKMDKASIQQANCNNALYDDFVGAVAVFQHISASAPS